MTDIFASEGLTPDEQQPSQADAQVEYSGLKIRPIAASQFVAPARAAVPAPSANPEADMRDSGFDPGKSPDALNVRNVQNVQSGDLQAGDYLNDNPDTNSVPKVHPTVSGSARDIFQHEELTPPGLDEQNANAMNAGIKVDSPDGPEQQQAVDALNRQQDQLKVLAQARFTPEQIEGFKNNPITFFEAFSKLSPKPAPFKFTGLPALDATRAIFRDSINDFQVLGIANKVKDGKELSTAEQEQLNNYIDYQVETGMRGFSLGGNVARGLAFIPSFAFQYAATDGGAAAVKTYVADLAEKAAVKGVTKSVVSGTVQTAARAAMMPGVYIPKYAEVRLNDSTAVTDKGQVVFKEGQESPAVSALKAFSYTAADVAGQVVAPGIGENIVKPLGKAVRTPLIAAVNNLSPEVRDALYQAYKAIQPNAQVSKVFTAAGWAGMLEQLGANRVSDVLHATTDLAADKNYTFDDYLNHLTPTKDQLMVEGGLIAIAGGVHTATSLTVNLLKDKGVPHAEAVQTAENMSAAEKEQFVQNNLEMPKSDYPDLPAVNDNPAHPAEDSMAALERQYDDPNTTPEQKTAIAQEMDALAQKAVEPYQNVSRETLADIPPEDGGPMPKYHYEADQIDTQISATEKSDPPAILNEESVFNRLYREMVNDLQPIEDLTTKAIKKGAKVKSGENPYLLASLNRQIVGNIRQNLEVATAIRDADGNMQVTGKSLKSIRDDFDNMFLKTEPSRDKRHQDFDDYQIAQRYMDLAQSGRDVLVTDEQKAKSVADMMRLQQKYGKDFHFFETFAQEERDFDRRILSNLVRSGLKSQEWFDKVVAENPKYVPLQRILEQEKLAPAIDRRGIFKDPNANRVVKSFKGSELEVKDITQSRMRNAARILQISATNDVLTSMSKLEKWMPEQVQVKDAPIVNKGTAKFKISYDPKLRTKLEETIRAFGGDIERSKSVKGNNGFQYALGSYSPMENLVRMKIGSTEGTLAHEVGHMLDYRLGLKSKMLEQDGVREELQKLAGDRLNADISLDQTEDGIKFLEEKKKVGKKYEEYIKNDDEILANFFDAYVNSPDQVRQTAPKAFDAFEKVLDENPKLSFIRDIKPSTSRAQEEIEKAVYGHADYGPPQSVPFYENGERKYLQLSKPIFEAFNALGPAKITLAEKILSAPFTASASLLRAGATLTPEFILRNPLRDMHDSFLQSGVRNTPVDFAKGLFNVIGRTDLYNQWERSGGKFDSFMALDDKGMEKAYREIFQEKSKLGKFLEFVNPLHILKEIAEGGEQATRVGIFAKAKKLGYSDTDAALASLEGTLNFNRSGTLGRRLNRFIPFLNAGIQGADKLVRTFKKDPASLTFWGVATITVPSLIMAGHYLYGTDDKTRNEYLELPQWQKDMFWNVKIGDQWYRYPKPFSYGYIFGSMPERIMNWMYQGNKPEAENAWLSIVKGLAGSVSPINDASAAIPPIVKSAIQDITNYDFFTGHSIYPAWMDKLEPAKRTTRFTSDTAKLLGEKLNVSPALIDDTVRTNAGGVGSYAMNAGDFIIQQVKKWNGEQVPEKPITGPDLPLIKGFTTRSPSGYRSNSANNFFDTWNTIQQRQATFNKLDGKEKSDYMQKYRVELDEYTAFKQYHKEMSGLQKQVDLIYENPSMKGDEKVKRIRELEDQITQIARQANMQYSRARGKK